MAGDCSLIRSILEYIFIKRGLTAYQLDKICSPRDWYAQNLGKINFPPKFVLFSHL
jgi:hypothetical protein